MTGSSPKNLVIPFHNSYSEYFCVLMLTTYLCILCISNSCLAQVAILIGNVDALAPLLSMSFLICDQIDCICVFVFVFLTQVCSSSCATVSSTLHAPSNRSWRLPCGDHSSNTIIGELMEMIIWLYYMVYLWYMVLYGCIIIVIVFKVNFNYNNDDNYDSNKPQFKYYHRWVGKMLWGFLKMISPGPCPSWEGCPASASCSCPASSLPWSPWASPSSSTSTSSSRGEFLLLFTKRDMTLT